MATYPPKNKVSKELLRIEAFRIALEIATNIKEEYDAKGFFDLVDKVYEYLRSE